ncbi:MAG: TIGR04338 family metallohydrolase, partial [Candidatus Nanopelagicales bacterium]
MQTQDPRVDRYRGAVYQAEDTIASVMKRPYRAVRLGSRVVTLPAEVRFGTLAGVQDYVDSVLAAAPTVARYPGRGPVQVQSRRGFRKATYSAGTINIPAADPRGRWALSRAVVLHEVAHHLAGVPGHGPEFRTALVHLYHLHLGAGAGALLEHLFTPLEGLSEPVDPATEDDQVRRVSALLAKAESTSSSQEAEAYLAKAGLVAQRHSVDMALAALERRAARPDAPTHRMLTIGEPRRALNKRLVGLMLVIAHAWGVRVDIGPGSTYVLVYGLAADLDRVESVFATASSMMQAKAHEHVQSGRWRGTTYLPNDGSAPRPVTAALARNAFCLGFVSRLGSNLAQAAAAARRGDAAAG